MRWIAVTVVVIAAFVAALLLSRQKVLWHVTEPGMTLPDVRAVLPEAVPPAQPKSLDNGLSLGQLTLSRDRIRAVLNGGL